MHVKGQAGLSIDIELRHARRNPGKGHAGGGTGARASNAPAQYWRAYCSWCSPLVPARSPSFRRECANARQFAEPVLGSKPDQPLPSGALDPVSALLCKSAHHAAVSRVSDRVWDL
jgi:hypothetical protein